MLNEPFVTMMSMMNQNLLVAVEGGLEPGIDLSDLRFLLSVVEVEVESRFVLKNVCCHNKTGSAADETRSD